MWQAHPASSNTVFVGEKVSHSELTHKYWTSQRILARVQTLAYIAWGH
jgi:hypothetical protein